MSDKIININIENANEPGSIVILDENGHVPVSHRHTSDESAMATIRNKLKMVHAILGDAIFEVNVADIANKPKGLAVLDDEGKLPDSVIPGGGGGGGGVDSPIRFFDYDGTLVASYTSVPSEMPAVPSHEGLVNGTWNYTLEQVAAQFNDSKRCDVGANYDTASGATEIDVRFVLASCLSPTISLGVDGEVTIDWGDGSTDDVAGSDALTIIDTAHTYSNTGDYTIKIIPKTDQTQYALRGSSSKSFFNSSTISTIADCVQNVRFASTASIGSNAFLNCRSLASVSIPSNVTSINGSSFYNCCSLISISIPSNVTSIGLSAFNGCYSLTSVSIPSNVTSIGSNVFILCYSLTSVSIPSSITSISPNAFQSCYSLTSVFIPSSVTSIGNNAFQYCYSLTSVLIPSSVASIGSNAFNGCCSIKEYHFTRIESVPTLSSSTVFNGINSSCIIYVPQSKFENYRTASAWSTYASYMVGE